MTCCGTGRCLTLGRRPGGTDAYHPVTHDTAGEPSPAAAEVPVDVHRDDMATATGPAPDPELAGRTAAPRVRASWRRSRDYGVPPDEVVPVFSGSPDTGSLLYECAHRVLTDLQATIPNEPVSLMVADSEGLVLARIGDDRDIQRSLDRVHLAPGFSYSERHRSEE